MKNWFKKGLLIILLITVTLFSFSLPTLAENSESSFGGWSVKYFVDDFNDPTDESYIVSNPCVGTFSNSITTNSELSSYIYYDGYSTYIRLYEYGDVEVNNPYSESEYYYIKIKATVETDGFQATRYFYCIGELPSGSGSIRFIGENDLYPDIDESNSFLLADSDFFDEDFGINFGALEYNGCTFKTISDVISNSAKISFSIRSADSPIRKYVFSMNNSSGFTEAAEAMNSINYSDVTIGTRVRHIDYGDGTITGFEYKDGKRMAEIEFDNPIPASGFSIQIPQAFNNGRLTVLKEEYDYSSVGDFIDGLAWVENNGKYGFISDDGTVIVPLQFDGATSFKEGYARVELAGKYGLVNVAGDLIIPCEYDAVEYISKDKTFNMFDGDDYIILNESLERVN